MEITVEHLGAVQFEIRARQHTIVCDQPEASGGFDEGMTPPELMLASLGSWPTIMLPSICESMAWPTRELVCA